MTFFFCTIPGLDVISFFVKFMTWQYVDLYEPGGKKSLNSAVFRNKRTPAIFFYLLIPSMICLSEQHSDKAPQNGYIRV